MRPKMAQLGILPELDSPAPADYSDTVLNPLSRQVWLAIKDRGVQGATSAEIAARLDKTHKSVSGRCTELIQVGLLRRTEAIRDGGVVFIAIGDSISW